MAIASRTETASSLSRSYSSAFASSTSVNFALTTRSSSSLYGHRSSSPPSPPSPPSSSVRFAVDQRPSSSQGMTVTKKHRNNNAAVPSSSSSSSSSSAKRTCMCSPTTHPGSFRCAYHKRLAEQEQEQKQKTASSSSSSRGSSKLNLRRSAMKNSLVRIGGVEGEIVKRTLTTLIRPSSHQLRRREAFQPRPSRLSIMSKA